MGIFFRVWYIGGIVHLISLFLFCKEMVLQRGALLLFEDGNEMKKMKVTDLCWLSKEWLV